MILDVLDTFCNVPLLENNIVELSVGGNVVSGLGELDVIFVLFEEVGKEVDWVVGFKVVLDVDLFPGIEVEPSWVEPKPPGVEPEPPVVEPKPPGVKPEPPEDEPEPEPELKLVPDPELAPVPEPKDQTNKNKILIKNSQNR